MIVLFYLMDMSETRLYYARYGSAVGDIYAASGGLGLTDLCINTSPESFLENMRLKYGAAPKKEAARFEGLFRELDSYFKGKQVTFRTPIDLRGTSFELRVWKMIAAIAWGEVQSYKWLAEKAGSPNGARAAGSACGRNPVPIVIPCHRVLATGGGLGGYTGGVDIKKKLLALEGVLV